MCGDPLKEGSYDAYQLRISVPDHNFLLQFDIPEWKCQPKKQKPIRINYIILFGFSISSEN